MLYSINGCGIDPILLDSLIVVSNPYQTQFSEMNEELLQTQNSKGYLCWYGKRISCTQMPLSVWIQTPSFRSWLFLLSRLRLVNGLNCRFFLILIRQMMAVSKCQWSALIVWWRPPKSQLWREYEKGKLVAFFSVVVKSSSTNKSFT